MAYLNVACVITAYNGRDNLTRLLDSLALQTTQVDVYIVDSGSTDGTAELAEFRCTNVLRLRREDFNAGGTRQLMVERASDYDIYVFMDQDAYLESPQDMGILLAPLLDPQVGAVCGRQLPYRKAGRRAQFALERQYPAASHVYSLAEANVQGPRALSMSLAFCAFRHTALQHIGGFPTHLIGGEGPFLAAKLLLNDWKVAYQGATQCRNRHDRSPLASLRRGYQRAVLLDQEPLLRKRFGFSAGAEPGALADQITWLGWRRVFLWPAAAIHHRLDGLGAALYRRKRLPTWLRGLLDQHKRYTPAKR